MRKVVFTLFALSLATAVMAQSDSVVRRTVTDTRPQRGGDHIMIQFGYTMWNNEPDSIHTTGIPRTFNVYFLLDFPFKSNPKWSAALGAGIGNDNMYFDKMRVGIADNTPSVRFQDLSDTTHFKKYKLATTYAEAPVEIRFTANPDDPARSMKFALGLKAGILLNAHTKGKTLESKSEEEINDFKQKDYSKRFFNSSRFSGTARIGYGHFTLFYSHQITTLFKEGLGPTIRPATIGLTISGL